jgi:hypothetical protein
LRRLGGEEVGGDGVIQWEFLVFDAASRSSPDAEPATFVLRKFETEPGRSIPSIQVPDEAQGHG